MEYLGKKKLEDANFNFKKLLKEGRPPEIAIMILGGYEEYLLTENIKKCLQDCITSILEKYDCYLVLRGANVGVTKLIGEICSTKTSRWNFGFTSRSIGLIPESFSKDGKKYDLCDEDHSKIYYKHLEVIREERIERKFELNPYLNFGIPAQNGSALKFEEYILRQGIPSIAILIGGGNWSLIAMKELLSLKDAASKPMVIVFDGSGKLADLLSSIHASLQGLDVSQKSEKLADSALEEYSTKQPFSDVINDFNNNDINWKAMFRLFFTQKEDQISIFKLYEKQEDLQKDDLEKFILSAALESKPADDLKLCVQLYAGHTTEVIKWLEQFPQKPFDMMTEWIKKSQSPTRIKKLIEKYNFDVEGYGKERLLEDLYQLDRADCPRVTASGIDPQKLKNYYLQYGKKKVEWYISELTNWPENKPGLTLEEFQKYVNELLSEETAESRKKIVKALHKDKELLKVHPNLGDLLQQYNPKSQEPHIKAENIDKSLNDLTDGNMRNGIYGNNEATSVSGTYNRGNDIEMNPTGSSMDFVHDKMINPIQELLINSVLFLDIPLAKLLWHYDPDNCLSNALLVLTLLNGLEENAKEVAKSAPDDFEKAKKHFEELACNLLDTCYKTDWKMTKKLLERRMPLWRNQTLIDVAGDIEFKSFFGKQACCMTLRNQWDKERSDSDTENTERNNGNNATTDERGKSCSEKLPPKWKLRLHAAVYWLSLLALGFFVVAPKTVVHEPFKWITFSVVLSLAVDEVCQVVQIGKGFCRNLKNWGKTCWNILDLIIIILFFVGFTLTYYHTYWSRLVFSFYFFISCMKAMQFCKRIKTFGVYLVMIRKMIKTMVKFMVVFFISIIGCGLFLTALLHPNTALHPDILLHMLFRPSLVLFGETGIERFELNDQTTIFGTSKVNLISEILVLIVMAVFLLFSNILLVNLLIAEFSAIHEETKERATEIWMFEQYELLEEFKEKPILPIPFSIIENAWFLFMACKRGCNEEKPETKGNKEKEICAFERFCYKKLFPTIPDDIVE